jgi:hypothetical protein
MIDCHQSLAEFCRTFTIATPAEIWSGVSNLNEKWLSCDEPSHHSRCQLQSIASTTHYGKVICKTPWSPKQLLEILGKT